MRHADLGGARRVVVKVGSSSLTTPDGGIDPARVATLVETLSQVVGQGREVVLVSSGAIAAERGKPGRRISPASRRRRPSGRDC